ncbi:transmembrane and coiled-coil domains 4 [Metarhizium guizhouense ARSEF 977]|uniref:Transmembrane and coiled-coil domains 4 n=1 Tax=Metarhizium guizhouense (strain ARSEF 977) TaxID=1276136 RepID=A0A0B4H3I5_METGA|nr:transmembrane and coiled-coil domains 4 [Metarhizium guizhouense ARSEF 977]
MAPLCADPRQIVIALNPARRAALLHLIEEIIAFMTLQLANPPDELGSLTGSDEDAQSSSPARKATPQKPTGKAAQQIEQIQKAAMKYMQDWRASFLPRLEEIIRVEDTPKIKEERKNRQDALNKKKLDTPEEGENLISFGDVQVDRSEDVAALQKLYHPIPTRLTTVPAQDRREALGCVLLLLLSTAKYSAHSRTMILHLASALEIPQTFVNKEEAEIAHSLMESSTAVKDKKETMSAEAEAEKRRQQNKFSRFWKVGLASVAGAAVIGVTGGLAAPLVAGAIGGIMGGVGLGGVASFLGIFWMNGALVGALFGAYGAKMTGELMDKYAKEVEDFKFIPLSTTGYGPDFQRPPDENSSAKETRRLRVTIGINGWLNDESDIVTPWRVLPSSETEVFALRYEMKTLLSLGTALQDLVQSFAWKTLKVEIIKRTVLATLWAALWPIQVLAAASNVDNPFNRASNRSKKAGRLLADALINKVQGERPVTLIGYSLGATAIHACLQSLAERKAFGLIDNVVIIGTPAPSDAAHWRTLRCVVSGTIFNVYSENDMMLGFVYRMHSLALGVAGLQAIEGVHGVQNLDLSEKVSGHLRYPSLTGEILKECGFTGVHAGGEIEKDDLIRMKDDHAEGKLVDLDVVAAGEPQRKDSRVAHDLQGLTISPPALSPGESGRPPLPARPAGTAEPRRREHEPDSDDSPVGAEHGSLHEGFDDPPLVERGGRWKREQTPESNDGDDGEFMAIKMEDNDDDDDEDDGHDKPIKH